MDHERGHHHRPSDDPGQLSTRPLIFSLVSIAALAAAPGEQRFIGIITDDMCADGNHAAMKMGPTDAECAIACVSIHDAMYVLYDGKDSYVLSDQKTPEKFAGKKVAVTGTLDTKRKTIHVDSISPAK